MGNLQDQNKKERIKPSTIGEINDLEIELERLREKIHAIENQRNELVQRAKEIITLLKG